MTGKAAGGGSRASSASTTKQRGRNHTLMAAPISKIAFNGEVQIQHSKSMNWKQLDLSKINN